MLLFFCISFSEALSLHKSNYEHTSTVVCCAKLCRTNVAFVQRMLCFSPNWKMFFRRPPTWNRASIVRLSCYTKMSLLELMKKSLEKSKVNCDRYFLYSVRNTLQLANSVILYYRRRRRRFCIDLGPLRGRLISCRPLSRQGWNQLS